MTIPVSPVQIQPPLAPRQPSAIEQIAPILEAISQQKLANAQLANYRSLTEQRKAEAAARAQDLQDQAEGARAFYDLVSGNAVTLKPEPPSKDGMPSHQGVDRTNGTVIPLPQHLKHLSPGAIVYYQKHIEGYNSDVVQQQQEIANRAQAEHTQLQDTITRAGQDEDRRISSILTRFAGRQWNRNTIGQTIGQVMAINPQKAGSIATTLNSMLPDYQIVLNPDGTVGYAAKQPTDASLGVKPPRPTDEQNKLATYATRVLEGNAVMTDLENNHPGIGQRVDDRIRALRATEQVPVLGRAVATVLTPQLLRGLSPDERRYVNARIDLGNALLRRASGAQINMEELDRETAPYVPTFRQQEDVVPSIQQRRLQQGLLFWGQAGSAADPNRLSPAARRSLLQNIAPHPGYSPDNPNVPKP